MGALQEGAVEPAIEFSGQAVIAALVVLVGWFVRNAFTDMKKAVADEKIHGRKLAKDLKELSERCARMEGIREGRMEAED